MALLNNGTGHIESSTQRTIMALTVFALLALVAACNGAAMFDPRIVNGVDAKLGERPYQVSLQQKGSNFHFCGGSVLNANYVITAAHCVVGQTANGIKVVAGTIDLTKPHTTRDVQKIIIHKGYKAADSWINDIALLKLVTPIAETYQIAFASLPSPKDQIKANDVAVVSGWGRLWEGGPTTTRLQLVNLFIANQEYCQYMYKNDGYNIYASHVCAFDPSVQKGSCHGDSGGPLTVKGKLVGLVSWARGCASTSYPTVYTRVSEHLDWIKQNAV